MTQKDWIKEQGVLVWRNKKIGEEAYIITRRFRYAYENEYEALVDDEKLNNIKKKIFDSKQEALNFLKQYMRTH